MKKILIFLFLFILLMLASLLIFSTYLPNAKDRSEIEYFCRIFEKNNKTSYSYSVSKRRDSWNFMLNGSLLAKPSDKDTNHFVGCVIENLIEQRWKGDFYFKLSWRSNKEDPLAKGFRYFDFDKSAHEDVYYREEKIVHIILK